MLCEYVHDYEGRIMNKELLVREMLRAELAKYQPDALFTLSSGKRSPWYFDVKSALMYERTRSIIAFLLNREIRACIDVVKPEPMVGGPGNAAYLLVQLVYGVQKCFVLRKVEKTHGIVGRIDGWAVQEGAQVVLVEDVITTGLSLLPCIKYVQECGGEVHQIITVVDRNEDDELGEYRELVRPISVKEDYHNSVYNRGRRNSIS